MRIISGKHKGRQISIIKGVRPTQDKVRKALFDILGDIEGLSFLELFAGSGAVGLEAISRGVSELALVEPNRKCQLAINKNIETLKLESCSLYPVEAEVAIETLSRHKRKFDIIFLDPPYHMDLAKKALKTLGAYDILSPNGFIVVQHFKKDTLPDSEGKVVMFKQSKYGDTRLSFFRKANPKSQ